LNVKSHIVISLGVLAAAVVGASAQAAEFAWSYTGLNGYTVNASGTLDASPLGGGAFQVTSISGTWNGIAITGLGTYASNDNLVYTSGFAVDYPGLAFTLANGMDVNAYSDTETDPSVDPYACGAVGYCEIGPGANGSSGLGPPSDPINQISFTLTEVPEPAVWAMMMLGLFGVGVAARRRREALQAI
jgi:hypothetical protein